jgi:hypothetical protein
MVVAYPLALLAAAAFATAIPLQHRAAEQAPDAQRFGAAALARFVATMLRNRWWLIAFAVDTAGFGLHALALHFGALAIVQPLLVTNVMFALPINRWLRREAVNRRELGYAAALGLGLGGFLSIATAGLPPSNEPADPGPAVIAGVLAALAAGSLVLAARRTRSARSATMLGIATGVAFAFTATLIKACTRVLSAHGPLGLAVSWQLYGLIAVGVCGLVLNQLSYQAGPLAASLPAITVIDPLVAVLLGVTVYDENLRHSPLALLGELISLAVLAYSTILLTRDEQRGTRPVG